MYSLGYAHGQSLSHILDKITKKYFHGTSNKDIWHYKISITCRGAILTIYQMPDPKLEVASFFYQLDWHADSAQRCVLPVFFRWIHYYDSNKSTGKETGKTHLCAVYKMAENLALTISKSYRGDVVGKSCENKKHQNSRQNFEKSSHTASRLNF